MSATRDRDRLRVTLRPLERDDAPVVHEMANRAFEDLWRRYGALPRPNYASDEGTRRGLARIRHLVRTDPGGAILAEHDGTPVGAALALLRDGFWGLSLLVVDPGAQSGGVGSRLLRAAVDHGAGARGGVILASPDARALRAYARAGFALHPSIEASGVPRRLHAPDWIRPGGTEDLELTERIDRVVRGAAHGPDIGVLLEQGASMLVAEGRGYAMFTGGDLRLLAATDEPAAVDLLRAFLAGVAEGAKAEVMWITSQQGWAVPVLLEAGLDLRLGGAVFTRGEIGSFRPYLPNGAYL